MANIEMDSLTSYNLATQSHDEVEGKSPTKRNEKN